MAKKVKPLQREYRRAPGLGGLVIRFKKSVGSRRKKKASALKRRR